MSMPTLAQRPTHRVVPLLRSEISRVSHRRLFRAAAIVLLGGIALISGLVFLASSNETGWDDTYLREEQQRVQNGWEACVQSIPADETSSPDEYCGPEPMNQPLADFDYGGDERYWAHLNLPIALIGATLAAAAVAFLMGASTGGAEWSSRSMTLQLLFEPRRLRLLAVKWLGLVVSVATLAVLAMLLALALGAATASLRGTWAPRDGGIGTLEEAFASGLLMMGLRGLVLVIIAATAGYAIAMLVRNTGASLGVAFFYFVIVEIVGRFALLKYGTQPYLIVENSIGWLIPGGIPVITHIDEDAMSYSEITEQLTNLRAITTLTAYLALLSLPAAWSFSRRDVS